MHIQLAVDVDKNNEYTITSTNLMPGGSVATEAEGITNDLVLDELLDVIMDECEQRGFLAAAEDAEADGEDDEEEDDEEDPDEALAEDERAIDEQEREEGKPRR